MKNETMNVDDQLIVTLKVFELRSIIKATIKETLGEYITQQNDHQKEKASETILIPRKTVAKLFSISTVSLDKWQRNGLLPNPIKQGSRVYYLKSEIDELIIKRKRKHYGE